MPWLPEGWGQAKMFASSGLEKTCWVSPEGKIYNNKAAIEKNLGYKFPVIPEPYDPSAWLEWLPRDWGMARVVLKNGTTTTVFVLPALDRFFYNRKEVEAVLNGKGGNGTRLIIDAPALDEPLPAEQQNAEAMQKDLKRSQGSSAPVEVGDCDTDTEVSKITSTRALATDGFELRSCRRGTAWAVLPQDVLCVDLEVLSNRMEASGFTQQAQAAHKYSFSGEVDLTLYSCGGKLVVKSSERKTAARIATLFVDTWLGVE